MDAECENIPIVMIRRDLERIPQYSLPGGYGWRCFREGDEHLWARIEAEVAGFSGEAEALERFTWELLPHREELESRCMFLMDPGGVYAGTITAWFNHPHPRGFYGRIHWVGLRRPFRGRGLSKPLMTLAMNRLARTHGSAYLTTQPRSLRAIKVYLDFGFEPIFLNATCSRAWAQVAQALGHPALRDYLVEEKGRG